MFTGFKKGSGINLDSQPSDMQGLRYALNAINKRDLKSISNEGGSTLHTALKAGFKILGQIYIDQNLKIIFLGDGTNSEIGKISNGTYTAILNNADLKFALGSYISGTFKYNENNEIIIYFTDYVNDIKFLNIDDVPTITDIRQLRIFRYVSKASTIGIDKVEIIEPEFRIETNSAVSKAIFSGRIKNNSNRTIGWLIIRLRIYESTQPGLTINELREQLNSGNLRRNITTSYIQTLDKESMKYIGQQIDTEDVRSSNLNVPPGETKSFTIENLNTKIITSDFWVWDYEIIRVW